MVIIKKVTVVFIKADFFRSELCVCLVLLSLVFNRY